MQVEVGEYFYGASMIPDEDEMKQFPITYGRIIDNNGFVIEVKENNNNCGKFMMNVIDLEESVAFYRDVLGMKLLRKRSNVNSKPKHGSLVACVVSCSCVSF